MILGAFAIAGQVKTDGIHPVKQVLSKTSPAKTSSVPHPHQQNSGTFVACVKQAVAQRKTSLTPVLQQYRQDTKRLLTIRNQALSGAQENSQTITQAMATYSSDFSALQTTFRATKKNILTTYKLNIKQCLNTR